MSSATDLAAGVKSALERNSPCRIAVHNEDQAELGKIAAERLASRVGGNPADLTFEIVPEGEADLIPVGTILV